MQPTRTPKQIKDLQRPRRATGDDGQAVTEVLMYGAVIVVVVVAVGAALEVLGVEVVESIRSGLGL